MASTAVSDQASRAAARLHEGVKRKLVAWTWTEKQMLALWELAQFLLYGGAKGGGKTVFLCRWAVLQCAQYAGNKIFLGRQRNVDFCRTTLETFKRFIDPSLWIHKESKQQFLLPWCNGQIDYGGLDGDDAVSKFNSAEYGGIGVDQAEELLQDQLGMLVGTLRHRLPDGSFPSFQVRLTANPAECFLREDFILNPTEGKENGIGRRVYIPARHTDNPFLPPDYVSNLTEALKHRPKLLKAYLEGSWDELSSFDLLIEPSWIEKAIVRKFIGPVRKRIVVCDPAREGDDENVTYVMELGNRTSRIIHTHVEDYTKNLVKTGLRLIATRRSFKANLIVVDAVGIGAGVADTIATVNQPNSDKPEPLFRYKSGSIEIPEPALLKYTNLKSWAWHTTADMFSKGVPCLPADDKTLHKQLLWQRSVLINELRNRVLTKKELKLKYNDSPDRGEAYVMGNHGLRIAQDLPDETPITPAREFWDRVKMDTRKLQGGEEEGFREI